MAAGMVIVGLLLVWAVISGRARAVVDAFLKAPPARP